MNPELYIELDLVLQLLCSAARALEQMVVPLLPDCPGDAHEERVESSPVFWNYISIYHAKRGFLADKLWTHGCLASEHGQCRARASQASAWSSSLPSRPAS